MQDFSAQTTVKQLDSKVIPPRKLLGWDTPRMDEGDMILLIAFRDHPVFVSVCVH
jgi:hypothetical protein